MVSPLREIEVGKTPVDQLDIFGLLIDDNIRRLNIPMHDTFQMGILQSLKQLINNKLNILQTELLL